MLKGLQQAIQRLGLRVAQRRRAIGLIDQHQQCGWVGGWVQARARHGQHMPMPGNQ